MSIRPCTLLSVLILAIWLPALTVSADTSLAPHRAEYLLTRDGLPVATMTMKLELLPNGAYRYQSTTRPHGALALVSMALEIVSGARITEESMGAIATGRFRPAHYRHQRDNEDSRELTVTFNWDTGHATMDSENKPWSMTIPEGTLDKLVVLLALRNDLAAGILSPSYPVADGGKLKTYKYRMQGRQDITTPAGVWNSVELVRSKNDDPPDYRLWLAPDLSYLPIRVERNENGSLFRMDLISVEGLGADPPAAPANELDP